MPEPIGGTSRDWSPVGQVSMFVDTGRVDVEVGVVVKVCVIVVALQVDAVRVEKIVVDWINVEFAAEDGVLDALSVE